MCELEDLRDQFETETRLRTEAESRLRQQEDDKKAYEHVKQELDETQNFMRQFEVALLGKFISTWNYLIPIIR